MTFFLPLGLKATAVGFQFFSFRNLMLYKNRTSVGTKLEETRFGRKTTIVVSNLSFVHCMAHVH